MISASWSMVILGACTVFVLGWIAGRGLGGFRDMPGPSASHAFTDVAPALRREIESAIAAGRKIEAIKLLREATGMGLQESKEAVEAMERN